MTKQQILEMTGLSEQEFYNKYPDQQSFMMEYGGMVEQYGSGGYTVRKSNDRKGKTHVVIGPGGKKKYFGDPKMGERGKSKHGKEAFYARHAKNLKNNPYFRAYAKATWEDGGLVDVYQLMGMPTPAMYEPGGKVRRRYKSPDRTDDNLSVIRSKSTDNLNLPDEYAASYDPNSLNLGIVDAKRYNRALGLDYNKSFGPFTAGIRGGVNKETTPTLYQKKGTRYEKVKEGEAKNILFGGLYGRVGTSIAPDLDTNTEVISFNPSLEVGLDKYGNSTKPYYDASVDVGFLNNMGSIGGGYTNRRQPYAVSLPSEGAGQESYPYAGASLNVPIVRDREGNPRLTVAGGYNIPLSKNTPDSGYAGLTYGFGKGGLIKRKDGSYSRRGLWDNIRANRGSGKKPTAEMLKQERKIRAAEKKEYGGMVNMYGMGGTTNIGDLSHVISAKNFPNMGYAMGGPVMYKKGAFVTGLKDYGLAIADNVTSIVNPDIIGPEAYSDTGFGKTMKGYSDVVGGLAHAGAPIIAGAIGGPIASQAVSAAQGMSNQLVPQQQDTSTTRQIGNMFGTLTPLAGSIYSASAGSGAGSTTTGTPQAAMGGPVNYPEGYQKNITFAMGGNVDMTTGELEHGENLNVYRNGRWKTVTKYESGGMGRHNADGTPKPAQEVALPFGGSIASRLYQKEDDLAEATNDTLHKEALHGKVITAKSGGYVGNSYANGGPVNGELRFPGRIEWTKRKKEAKEEAMAMKKYGGAIKRMFAKGGMVPMYDGGSTVLNTSAPSNWSWGNPQPVLPLENPGVYASLPEFMGTSTVPGSSFGSTPTNPFDISLPLQPMQPRAIDPSSVMTAFNPRPTASPQGVYTGPGSPYYNPGGSRMPAQTFDASNITGFDPGQYPNRVPYRTEAGESWPGTAASKTAGSPGAGGDMSNFGKYAETAAMLGPGLYNLGMGLFSKPEKFDKLKLSGQLKSYETPYQTDYAPYYATKYALRQAGQSSPAALSQLFATFSKQEAANRLANREQNLRRQMAADQFNLSRADQVAQANLAIDQLNAQQRAARRNMIGEGISNIGQVAAYNKGMRQDKEVLGDLYKNYEFKDGKWVYKG
jgi:hypothetical protein